jgi:hypothetical protein
MSENTARQVEEAPRLTVAPDPEGVSAEMDRLNLEQALRDTEVATLRVKDLTQRLVASTQENRRLQEELDVARTQLAELGAEVDAARAVRNTRTFKLTALQLQIAAALRRKLG